MVPGRCQAVHVQACQAARLWPGTFQDDIGLSSCTGETLDVTSALVVWHIWASLSHKSVHGQCPWVVV